MARLTRFDHVDGAEVLCFHAAAGGLGLRASQWSRLLGLTVICIVSTERAEIGRTQGCTSPPPA